MDVTLGVALPKGDRQSWLVEKAVELGVTHIVPLRTQRGVAQPVEQALFGCGEPSSRPRSSAAAIGCCRSTSRNTGPTSWKTPPRRRAGCWRSRKAFTAGPHLPIPEELPDAVLLAVGPEGGFAGRRGGSGGSGRLAHRRPWSADAPRGDGRAACWRRWSSRAHGILKRFTCRFAAGERVPAAPHPRGPGSPSAGRKAALPRPCDAPRPGGSQMPPDTPAATPAAGALHAHAST